MRISSLECRIVCIACACVALSACISPQQRVVAAVIDAHRLSEAIPLPHRIDETLTIASVYPIQTRVVRHELKGAQPAGFKAGLTSAQSQARFRATQPVAGVLARSGLQQPCSTISLTQWRGLNIETEVAMRIGTPIRRRLDSIEVLRDHVDAIAAAIELPNLYFDSPAEVTAADIVASNVGAAAYILGEFVASTLRDPNEISPRLICNGTEVNKGYARDALGDQWQAALWLVNTMIEQGWTLESGQILLTGALGRMVPAAPGECSAEYGSWGTMTVHIVP
jgi:2-keto-4-pentenoate hydratase